MADPNSLTYAARARAHPELQLQTSDISSQDSAVQSPTPSNDPYSLSSAQPPPQRRSSVPDRSPLQDLELKLGSRSKEEKRARVEEAEEGVRRQSLKKNALNDSSSLRVPSREMLSKTRSQHAAPIATSESGSQSYPGAYVDRNPMSQSTGIPNGPAYNYPNQAPVPSRSRTYGHDAALTGGAAAAALGAYARQQYPTNGLDVENGYGSYNAKNGFQSDTSSPQPYINNYNDYGQSTPGQAQFQNGRSDWTPDIRGTNQTVLPDPIPARTMQMEDSYSPQYADDQRHGGQPAQNQKRVSFGGNYVEGSSIAVPQTGEHHHMRDFFHRDHQYVRRYEPSPFLDEWKRAKIATLFAEDLNLDDSSTYQAWWERNETSRRRSKGRDSKPPVPPKIDHAQSDEPPPTKFNPPLTLKCGPLLRYTGIHKDTQYLREFWKGSVMIVTTDTTSSYGSTPKLRIFKQGMNLIDPNTTQQQEDTLYQGHSIGDDHLAGLTKVGRDGRTLFVKPVHELPHGTDLSQMESNEGIFERESLSGSAVNSYARVHKQDGEQKGRYREVKAIRLHSERSVTFWRFNIQVELTGTEERIAYRINNGPTSAFWIPAKGQTMNMMFHSCNGFSLSVDPNAFSGPDPLWRDVLNSHQIRPFHCMIGGGDQIYNDAAMKQTRYFQEWLGIKNPEHKHNAEFSAEMQDELEKFYLDRYAMWFSQGLFGMANSQIPMINLWDDHDIIDGFGSYPNHFMTTPVFSGVGAVAFKYYMLFQHQSVPDESQDTEPSWVLGAEPGPYINQLSRSIFLSLGRNVAFLGIDCRTERMRNEILSQDTYDIIFDRCRQELITGETKHLLVLLGVPIAYPRLNFLENVLTSRAVYPLKSLGRAGILSGLTNKFDGGIEILDDLDDHWTAKHHKQERNWFVQELQELAKEKSVRITILGGDVHLAAVGQFYSNRKLGIPKDHDHRYMPNVISSAIVNTPPPEMMGDALNKRNKIHHLDKDTDEDMIPLFSHDVDGKQRNNNHLLPRRNWCSLREYAPGATPPPSPPPPATEEPPKRRRSFSLTRSSSLTRRDPNKPSLLRRLSTRKGPPSSYRDPNAEVQPHSPYANNLNPGPDGHINPRSQSVDDALNSTGERGRTSLPRANSFRRRPTTLSRRASAQDQSGREGHIDLQGGLDIVLHCEIDQKDPAGVTTPYRLIVPALFYQDAEIQPQEPAKSGLSNLFGSLRGGQKKQGLTISHPYPLADSQPTAAPVSQFEEFQPRAIDGEEDYHYYNSGLKPGGRTVTEEPTMHSDDQFYDAQSLPGSSPPQALTRNKDRPIAPSTDASNDTFVEQAASDVPRSSSKSDKLLGIESKDETPTVERSSSKASKLLGVESSRSSQEPSHNRPTQQRRYSASGPPPPKNLDELPASVRNRYLELNDPETKRYTRMTDPSQKRYSQRYYSQAGESQHDHGSNQAGPPRQRYSQFNDPGAHKRYSQYEPTAPAPPPPPPPEDTLRRYSKGPMESPLLPTNINQLRSSTHRTLQNVDPSIQQRSVSGPASTSSAAYVNSLPVMSNNTPDAYQSYPRQDSNKIPAFPSPLSSHAPDPRERSPYGAYDESNQYTDTYATSRTQPLGREYDDKVYGITDDTDFDLEESPAPRRPARPNKLQRHFGSTDQQDYGRVTHPSQNEKKSGGLSGIVRRLSSRRG